MKLTLNLSEKGYQHINNFSLTCFFIYVIIWYLQIGVRFPALGAIRIEFLLALFLFFLTFFVKDKYKIFNNPISLPTLFLILAIAIEVPLSQDIETSWNIFFNRVIKFAFMGFFIASFVRSPKGLIVFLCAFIIACMKMGEEGLIGQITGSMVWQNQGVMRLHGSTPMYGHPNSFSGMALGTIPFAIYLFPVSSRFSKAALILLLLFAFNIILHTGSRTGYVALLIALFYIIFKSKRKAISIIIVLLISILSFTFIDNQYKERFSSIFTGKEIEGNSMGKRKQILVDAIEIFSENPLGIGVGAFPFVRKEKFGRVQDTHNLYLEVATNIGIQGLLIFLFFVYKILLTLKKIKTYAKEKRKKILALKERGSQNKDYALLGNNLLLIESVANAVSLYIIIRLGLGLFGMDLYEIYWWFAAGTCIALYNILETTKKIIASYDENDKK